MATNKRLDLLLKEIEDPYVQENFYKLKQYLEKFEGGGSTPGPVGPQGPAGPQGIPGAGGVMTVTAGQNLSALKFVYIGADGKAYLGDPSVLTTAEVVGMTLTAVTTGAQVQVQPFGLIQDPSFTFGASNPVFLGILGSGTTTPPTTGYRVRVGQGLDNGKFLIDIDETIKLT